MTKDLLLEIGSDEIPARYLLSAIHDIKTRTQKALEGSRLTFDDIRSYGTPRRLAVYVTGLVSQKASMLPQRSGAPLRKLPLTVEEVLLRHFRVSAGLLI
jgi:glycyl-tRNA synthetase beta chain